MLRWWNLRLSYLIANLVLLGAASTYAQDVTPWQQGNQHRFRLLSVDESPGIQTGFQLMPHLNTGISFTNQLPVARHMTNQMLLNGSGVAAADVDGDGQCDLYFNSIDGPNKLFRNLGDWKFEDIAVNAGVECLEFDATACVLADLNGDALPELLVNTMYQGLRLFRNLGNQKFEEITQEAGMKPALGGMTVAIGDFDVDGLPDIYVSRYRAAALMDVPNAYVNMKTIGGKRVVTQFNGRPTTEPDLQHRFYVDARGGVGEYGEPDSLYRNRGNLRFQEVSWTGGVFQDEQGNALSEIPRDWGLAAMFRDLNQDGYPDLYVCNDFDTPDRIWINTRKGGFQALPADAIRQTSWFAMGIDVADVDRDGDDDILVLDMLARSHSTRMNQLGDVKPVMDLIRQAGHRPQYMKTTLQMNRGDTTFAEVGQWAGLAASDWAWGTAFLDVDLDGFEDVLITNGHERDGRDIDVANQLKSLRRARKLSDKEIFQNRLKFPRFNTPNIAYRNLGDGTFKQISSEWGFNFNGVSHGIALADLDKDGDLDVVVNNLNDPASVYQNLAQAPRVAVQLKGLKGNSQGVGARVELETGDLLQSQEIIAGGKYLSSDQSLRTFALKGNVGSDAKLRVVWPGGGVTEIDEVKASRLYEIQQAPSVINPKPIDKPKSDPKLFSKHNIQLEPGHRDPMFDDWARQPLMDASLAHEGPAVGWVDLNDDGWEDLVLSSARGGKPGVWLNQQGKAFEPYDKAPFHLPVSRDQIGLTAWKDSLKGVRLLMASSNYEDGLDLGSPVREYRFKDKKTVDEFSGRQGSVGVLSLGDVDRDGDLDLFVGTRVFPGRYPEPPSSFLFLNVNGQFKLDEGLSKLFENLGMVRSASWVDIDRDGFPELFVSLEWGAIRCFKNRNGQLKDQTTALGLSDHLGWWSGLAFGDFDENGTIDFVAGNMGLNGPHHQHSHHPVRLYYGDVDGNQVTDIVRSHYEEEVGAYAPDLQLGALSRGIPVLPDHYKSHRAFGEQSVSQVFEKLGASPSYLEVNWSQTTLFLNHGGRFSAVPLPREAQWSAVSSVVSGDFDGDGHLDVFLAQNHFQFEPMTPRMDAGYGLLCLGDGKGQFKRMPHFQSGIKLLGEQRGAACADWNHDGRLDLIVGQNNGKAHLYSNQSAEPGVMVRLKGRDENPWAIGAQIRLIGEEEMRGPWQVIQTGAGYGSQHGMLQVLGSLRGGNRIEVFWPNGGTSVHTINRDLNIQLLSAK
jgi:hypothetical protein